MKEFTFGELKQGLLCCTVYKNCSGCPLYMGPEKGPREECTYQLMSAAFNCINTLEKDLTESKSTTAKEFAGFVQEWLTYSFPCAEDCGHNVQQVLEVYLNYLKQPSQGTEVEF
jgi:hypothetical protein